MIQDSARFSVRIAGGHRIANNVGVAVAAAKALDLAKHGYRVWIREQTRTSWAAETIVVTMVEGKVIVRTTDNAQPRYLSQFQSLIAELEENVA